MRFESKIKSSFKKILEANVSSNGDEGKIILIDTWQGGRYYKKS
jgi:hypothetical protein